MDLSHAQQGGEHSFDLFEQVLRIQWEASALGFDWTDVRDVLAKVEEELREIREAVDSSDSSHAGNELGDLLFAAVSVARFLHVNPSEVLGNAAERFLQRLEGVKREAAREGRGLGTYSTEELDVLWERVKGIMRQ